MASVSSSKSMIGHLCLGLSLEDDPIWSGSVRLGPVSPDLSLSGTRVLDTQTLSTRHRSSCVSPVLHGSSTRSRLHTGSCAGDPGTSSSSPTTSGSVGRHHRLPYRQGLRGGFDPGTTWEGGPSRPSTLTTSVQVPVHTFPSNRITPLVPTINPFPARPSASRLTSVPVPSLLIRV